MTSPFNSVIEQYREAFRKHGNSPEAVLWPKGRQRLRFSRLTSHFAGEEFCVLDFGCGLGHLKTYLDARFRRYRYTGVDLVPEFIAECRRTFPDGRFVQVTDVGDVAEVYDYVVLSGVFNILFTSDHEQHLARTFGMLENLFARTRIALSCDFMTDKVDFCGPDAFHMNEPALVDFVQGRLSARYSVDHTYMPYEFCVTVYKEQAISRPANVYQGFADEDSQA